MPYEILPPDGGAAPTGRYEVLPPADAAPSMVGQLMRQAGLAARYATEGIAGLPNMIGDALNKVINDPSALAALPPGTLRSPIQLGAPSQALSSLLTQAGLPSPNTPTERVVGGVTRALAGTGGAIKAAEQAPGEIAALLASRPGAQAASAAAAGASGAAAQNVGAGPLGEMLASLAGGVGGAGAMALGQAALGAAARGLPQVLKPFTQAGQDDIVGATLNRFASDKGTALQNMDADAGEIVPGSQPTSAQAGRDAGLLQLERALGAQDSQFQVRKSENNSARNAHLDEIAGTPQDVDYYKQARSATAQDLYDKALAESPDLTPWIKGQLTQLAQRPAFKAAQDEAITIAQNQGLALDGSNVTQVAHYTKMALDDMINRAGRAGDGNAQYGLISTRDKLVSLIESKDFSPSYRNARSTYAAMSEPIDQMSALQDIQQRTRLAGPDVTGQPIISQAKWQNVVAKNIDDLGDKLTPDQTDRLRAIGSDLDRASLSDTAGRAVGSNTFQNLSTANLLGAALGGDMANNAVALSIARPLRWLYAIPEKQVRDLLSQAMLEPSLARALMAKATRPNVEFLGAALRDKARAIGIGATVGGATEATQ